MSGIKKISDIPEREYSLESLNDFLKIENNVGNPLDRFGVDTTNSRILANHSSSDQYELGGSSYNYSKLDFERKRRRRDLSDNSASDEKPNPKRGNQGRASRLVKGTRPSGATGSQKAHRMKSIDNKKKFKINKIEDTLEGAESDIQQEDTYRSSSLHDYGPSEHLMGSDLSFKDPLHDDTYYKHQIEKVKQSVMEDKARARISGLSDRNVSKKLGNRDDKSLFYTSTTTRANDTTLKTSKELLSSKGALAQIRHHPQVMDRDTEAFKNRLDNMLNQFKLNTLTEYMETKRALLEEQASVISSEKAQYELKLRTKEVELQETKELLATQVTRNEKMELMMHLMSKKLGADYKYKRMVKTTGRAFMGWKMMTYYSRQKKQWKSMLKKKAAEYYLKRGFRGLLLNSRDAVIRKAEDKVRNEANSELEMVSMKYQKEITLLQSKLRETLDEIESINRSKANQQEQLKKTIMKGLCQMNLDAMNILQPSEVPNASYDPRFDQFADKISTNLTNMTAALNAGNEPKTAQERPGGGYLATENGMIDRGFGRGGVGPAEDIEKEIVKKYSTEARRGNGDGANGSMFAGASFGRLGANQLNKEGLPTFYTEKKSTQLLPSSLNLNGTDNNVGGINSSNLHYSDTSRLLKRHDLSNKLSNANNMSKQEVNDLFNSVVNEIKMKSNKTDFSTQNAAQTSQETSPGKVVMFRDPPAESKDHLWRQAPIIGKKSAEEPVIKVSRDYNQFQSLRANLQTASSKRASNEADYSSLSSNQHHLPQFGRNAFAQDPQQIPREYPSFDTSAMLQSNLGARSGHNDQYDGSLDNPLSIMKQNPRYEPIEGSFDSNGPLRLKAQNLIKGMNSNFGDDESRLGVASHQNQRFDAESDDEQDGKVLRFNPLEKMNNQGFERAPAAGGKRSGRPASGRASRQASTGGGPKKPRRRMSKKREPGGTTTGSRQAGKRGGGSRKPKNPRRSSKAKP